MLEILLLGRPTFRVNGRPIALRDRKGIGLIAYLSANGTTSRDKLADLLWPDMSQPDARRNLRQRIYELKDRLPEGFFASDGDIIRLGIHAEIDLAHFRAHISVHEDEAAMRLWRGRFLENLDVPDAPGFKEWLEATRETLTGSYYESLRRLAIKHEERGDLRGALETHQRLLADDELQEFHQREVIRLLEALGERENAILHYERYRQTLKQELGIAPLPQTQQIAERVQNAIQRKASDLTILETPDAAQPELRSPLVGRETEWAKLERAKPGLTLITGEPGIGKSRLADEMSYYAARKGAVHRLQGREGSSGSPLYPVAESLREALREPTWVDTLEPVWRTECARLVPEIDPSVTPQPMPSLEGRVRFIEGLARAIIASVGDGGAIVLDDLHWFDAATLELVAHLARRAKNANVRLISTARTVELASNEAAAPILVDLKRDGLLTRLDLEPLRERDVRVLIQSLSGGADAPAFAKRLHTATVGNPFFLLETLRELFGSGQLQVTADGTWTTPHDDDTESYAELPIPATVRETVIARVDRTGADARRLLEAASLAGDGFDLALISSATALTEWEGVDAIERAVRAELLEEANDGYRFNHDLIRRALEDGLNPDRKKLIHRKLAASLEAINGQPAQIAEHFERGGLAKRAALWSIKAGDDAIRIYAHEIALMHYSKALKNDLDITDCLKVHSKRVKIFRNLDKKDLWLNESRVMFKISEDQGDEDFLLESETNLAEIEISTGSSESAYFHILKAIKRSKASWDTKANAILVASQALFNLNEFLKAKNLLYKLKKSESELHDDILGKLYIYLAELETFLGNLDKADIYNQKVENDFISGIDKNFLGTTIVKGNIARLRSDFDLALECFEKVLNLSEKYNFARFRHISLINLSKLQLLNSNFEKALGYAELGLTLEKGAIYVEMMNEYRNIIHFIKNRAI